MPTVSGPIFYPEIRICSFLFCLPTVKIKSLFYLGIQKSNENVAPGVFWKGFMGKREVAY